MQNIVKDCELWTSNGQKEQKNIDGNNWMELADQPSSCCEHIGWSARDCG